ncbi:MAG: glycosyltransferase family 2 protein [Firmicutes bacterium]|nr:glycosyltransferase family 2 protein [Bacillota bacterium]MDY5335736.1 glycosyltransferase family 2 protein [Bacilli bacterium]
MKILLIIPAYNEEKNILNTINMIENYKRKMLDYIVINDGSLDKTEEVLKDNNINHICLVNNLGIGAAVQTGYKYAYTNNYDIAIQFDGDGQHDINYIDKLIDTIVDEKYDMVIGSRFVGNDSSFKSTKMRRVGIKLLSFVIKILTGVTIKDVTSGYRAVNRNIIEKFSKNYIFDYPEPITNLQLIKEKYKIKEVSVGMKERKYGKSSISALKSFYYMFNVILNMLIIGLGGKKCR